MFLVLVKNNTCHLWPSGKKLSNFDFTRKKDHFFKKRFLASKVLRFLEIVHRDKNLVVTNEMVGLAPPDWPGWHYNPAAVERVIARGYRK